MRSSYLHLLWRWNVRWMHCHISVLLLATKKRRLVLLQHYPVPENRLCYYSIHHHLLTLSTEIGRKLSPNFHLVGKSTKMRVILAEISHYREKIICYTRDVTHAELSYLAPYHYNPKEE